MLHRNCACYNKPGGRRALNKMSDARLRLLANTLVTNKARVANKTKNRRTANDEIDELQEIVDWAAQSPTTVRKKILSRVKAALGFEEDDVESDDPMADAEADATDLEDEDDVDNEDVEGEDEEPASNAEGDEEEDETTENTDIGDDVDPPDDDATITPKGAKGGPSSPSGNKRALKRNKGRGTSLNLPTTLKGNLQAQLKRLHPTIRGIVENQIKADREQRVEAIKTLLKPVTNAKEKQQLFDDIKTLSLSALKRLVSLNRAARPQASGPTFVGDLGEALMTTNTEAGEGDPIIPVLDWSEFNKSSTK